MSAPTRTMHELLRDVSRSLGDPDVSAEYLTDLAGAIRRRATAIARDLEAIAGERRDGRRPHAARERTPA